MTRIRGMSRHVLRPFVTGLVMIGLVACTSPAPEEGRRGAIPLDRMETGGLERIATRFKEAGEPQTALKFYMEALEREPDNAGFHVEAGELNLALGERAKAHTHFERALAIEPFEDRAVARLAGLYISEGNPQMANSLLADLHGHEKGTAYTLNLQAVTLDLLGRSLDARRAYAKALLLTPDDVYILSNMALSMAIAGEFAAARDILEDLAEEQTDMSVAQENLALVAAMAGNPKEALMIAVEHMDPELAYANKGFYERLATIGPADRAQAIFLGHLPSTDTKDTPTPEEDGPSPLPTHSADSDAATDEIQDPVVETEDADEFITVESKSVAVPIVAETVDDAIPLYHLQLGSFDSPRRLKRGWQELKDLSSLEGFSPSYEEAVSAENDPTLRLLVGPVRGYSVARTICEELLEEKGNAGCVVLPQRQDVKELEGGT